MCLKNFGEQKTRFIIILKEYLIYLFGFMAFNIKQMTLKMSSLQIKAKV